VIDFYLFKLIVEDFILLSGRVMRTGELKRGYEYIVALEILANVFDDFIKLQSYRAGFVQRVYVFGHSNIQSSTPAAKP